MGVAKRIQEDYEQQRSRAIDIAVESNVLEQCEFHDDTVFEGSKDITEAYKLGNAKFSRGDLDGDFDDRTQMTDLIKEVVEENCADECPSCAHYRDKG